MDCISVENCQSCFSGVGRLNQTRKLLRMSRENPILSQFTHDNRPSVRKWLGHKVLTIICIPINGVGAFVGGAGIVVTLAIEIVNATAGIFFCKAIPINIPSVLTLSSSLVLGSLNELYESGCEVFYDTTLGLDYYWTNREIDDATFILGQDMVNGWRWKLFDDIRNRVRSNHWGFSGMEIHQISHLTYLGGYSLFLNVGSSVIGFTGLCCSSALGVAQLALCRQVPSNTGFTYCRNLLLATTADTMSIIPEILYSAGCMIRH